MRRPGGFLIVSSHEGMDKECDTFTCGHCQRVVFVKPMCDPADAGGLCYACDRHICRQCVGLGKCEVIEKKLERWEDAGRIAREYGLQR